ncbi:MULTISPECIES: STAS domain-containing protein [Vibrio]|uniref:NTP-binding protein n=2 Tax=Vibrio TaxID=662 RepID=A0A1E5D198_9VIBR|nr:lipid asymmetry maintenance protein MlaB [Vibrio genomosp. F6]OEE77137.1 NTP-binding protein [Vibrio genomosp. F6 str. FF-238]RBW66987.1 STAS domain-containing protein [Vibrionales bacterium C3R12]
MTHSQWQQLSDDKFALSGDLDRDTVPALWEYLRAWKTAQTQVNVDLSSVQRIDSSGMVMLIHLIEHAKKQNCHIMLGFVPEQLRTLFQLSNIQPLMAEHIQN